MFELGPSYGRINMLSILSVSRHSGFRKSRDQVIVRYFITMALPNQYSGLLYYILLNLVPSLQRSHLV